MEEDRKYENIITGYTFEQLGYERVILLKQYSTIKKQLAILDDELKRRLENK